LELFCGNPPIIGTGGRNGEGSRILLLLGGGHGALFVLALYDGFVAASDPSTPSVSAAMRSAIEPLPKTSEGFSLEFWYDLLGEFSAFGKTRLVNGDADRIVVGGGSAAEAAAGFLYHKLPVSPSASRPDGLCLAGDSLPCPFRRNMVCTLCVFVCALHEAQHSAAAVVTLSSIEERAHASELMNFHSSSGALLW
jgi:hypothetical protein